jgi:hypothetical protein
MMGNDSLWFGIVLGFITYRTPKRKNRSGVSDNDAMRFVQLLYAEFINEGLNAGDVLAKAKRDATRELKRPSWLFYCLYGPASARRITPTSSTINAPLRST